MKPTVNIRGTSIRHWPGFFQLGAKDFGLNSSNMQRLWHFWHLWALPNICNQLKAYLGLPGLTCHILSCPGGHAFWCCHAEKLIHACTSIANFLPMLFFDLLCIEHVRVKCFSLSLWYWINPGRDWRKSSCDSTLHSIEFQSGKLLERKRRKRRKRAKRPVLSMRILRHTRWMTGKCPSFCLWSSTVMLS